MWLTVARNLLKMWITYVIFYENSKKRKLKISSFNSPQYGFCTLPLDRNKTKAFAESCFRIMIKNRGRGAGHLWLGPFQWCFLKKGHRTKGLCPLLVREVPCSAPWPGRGQGFFWCWVLDHLWRPFWDRDSYHRRGHEDQSDFNLTLVLCLAGPGMQP